MGRGRQRAKQAKVARELKYRPDQTDLAALQRELGSTSKPHRDATPDDDTTPDDDGGEGETQVAADPDGGSR